MAARTPRFVRCGRNAGWEAPNWRYLISACLCGQGRWAGQPCRRLGASIILADSPRPLNAGRSPHGFGPFPSLSPPGKGPRRRTSDAVGSPANRYRHLLAHQKRTSNLSDKIRCGSCEAPLSGCPWISGRAALRGKTSCVWRPAQRIASISSISQRKAS